MRSSRHRGFTLALAHGLGQSPVVPEAIASISACSLFSPDTLQDSSNRRPQPLLIGGANLPWVLSMIGRPKPHWPSSVVLSLGWPNIASGFATRCREEERQVLRDDATRKHLNTEDPLPRMNLCVLTGQTGATPIILSRDAELASHRKETNLM